REYDPAIGRFLSRDPIGLAGGLNQFAFGGGRVLSEWDPLGTDSHKQPTVQRDVWAGIDKIGEHPLHIDTSLTPANALNLYTMGVSGFFIAGAWNGLVDSAYGTYEHGRRGIAGIASGTGDPEESAAHLVRSIQSAQQFQGHVTMLALPFLASGAAPAD